MVYEANNSPWFHRLNALFTIGAFPVHFWGMWMLPDKFLLLFPLSFSVMWLFYSWKKAEATVRSIRLLQGHEKVRFESFTFFGGSKLRDFKWDDVTCGIEKATQVIKELIPPKYDGPLPAFVTNKVRYLDAYRPVGEKASRKKQKQRVRYLIDYKSASNKDSLIQLWYFAVATADRHFSQTIAAYDKTGVLGAKGPSPKIADVPDDEELAEMKRRKEASGALLKANRDSEASVKEAEKAYFQSKLRTFAHNPSSPAAGPSRGKGPQPSTKNNAPPAK